MTEAPELQALAAALRKSEARLAETQALAHAGHWELNLRTRSLWLCDEVFTMLGRAPTAGPPSPRELLEMIHPDDRARCERAYYAALEQNDVPPLEFRARVGRRFRTFVAHARRHFEAPCNATFLHGVVIDITDHRWRAEKEAVSNEMTELLARGSPLLDFLQRGSKNFERLFPDTVCATRLWVSVDAPHVVGSPSFPSDLARLLAETDLRALELHNPRDPHTSFVLEDLTQHDGPAALRPIGAAAVAQGFLACWIVPMVSSQQERFGVLTVYSRQRGKPPPPALAMSERAARLTSVLIERTESTRSLRESEARMRGLFEHAPLGVGLSDAAGNFLYGNRALLRLVGGGRQAQGHGWAQALHESDRPRVLEQWRRIVDQETASADLICRFVSPRLGTRTTHLLINAVRDGNEVRGFVVTVEDITERTQLEAQLRQAQKMEAVGKLAGGIAHDFNNLLTVILGSVSMLQGAQPENPAIRQIADAAERAAALTGQLLTFGRKQPMQLHTVELGAQIARLSEMLRRLIGEHIALETELPDEPAFARVDPNMIDQVLLNLVVNARDAMPLEGGTITLRLTPRSPGRDGDSFHHLSVSDTGSGIAPEDLPHIFEPFYTTKPKDKGTGLGLATAYGIVQQHGGYIHVESELGQGTTFHVYLPSVANPSTDR